jgi:hypothetical protein
VSLEMIRVTHADEAFVWFEAVSRPGHKIEWPLEEYLAYARAKGEIELKILSIDMWDSGVISEMSEAEVRQVWLREDWPFRIKPVKK